MGVLEREDQCASECVYVRERVIARALTSVCMCGVRERVGVCCRVSLFSSFLAIKTNVP